MEREQTLRILNALANGVHPATGEPFAPDSVYQHPDTVRALFEAVRAVGRDEPPPTGGAARPSGRGARWSEQEEELLSAGFDAGKAVDELAQLHHRTRAAIEARLFKLGKIDASQVSVALRYPLAEKGPQVA